MRIRNRKSIWVSLMLLLASGSAQAVGPVFEAGAYFGGDELVSATFYSGETQSIDAGGLIDLSLGVAFEPAPDWLSRLTVGFRFDEINAANGSIDWDRTVVEGKALKKVSDFWYMGGGLTYHLEPELSGTGVAAGSVKFDDALGFLFEADYVLPTGLYFGGKFTLIDYEFAGETVQANSLGAIIGWQFE